jgi:flagellin-like protein
MNKRGISPLIATVLIIGFTVVLSVVVYVFVTSTVQEGIIDTETKIELGNLCLNSNLDYTIDCHLGPYLRMRANNNGNTNITGLIVSIDRGGKVDVLESNISLGPYGAKVLYSKFKGLPEDIEKIRFAPRFTFDSNKYDCIGAREINVDEIPMCEDYLENNKGDEWGTLSPLGWDIALHGDAVQPSSWSNGYNSGVRGCNLRDCSGTPPFPYDDILCPLNPQIGYHAKWVNSEGFEGSPGIKMMDDNAIAYTSYSDSCNPSSPIVFTGHRWLGINQWMTSSINVGLPDWNVNDNFTVSFYLKSDSLLKRVASGVHHRDTTGATSWGDSWNSQLSSSINKWELHTYTFTYDSTWDSNNFTRLYFYGHYPQVAGTNGVIWIDNIQLFKTPVII